MLFLEFPLFSSKRSECLSIIVFLLSNAMFFVFAAYIKRYCKIV
jgi:hypothetical protein